MSHVAAVQLEVLDLDELEAACKNLGLELARDQKTYRWYGRSVGDYPLPAGFREEDLGKCEHAIRVPGSSTAYEIGVVKSRTGRGYTLLWDFFAGGYGMMEKVGTDANKLRQAYAAEHTVRFWRRKGLRVTTETQKNGQIVVRARR